MPTNPNKLSRFWQELKRRSVVHVITVYATAAFVIIELVNNLTEPLNLPASLSTIVIIVLAVGFPLAIILSWLYDLTSGSFERTKPLGETPEEVKPVAVPNAWKIATYVSFVVIIGLVVLNITGRGNLIKPGMIQSLVILPFDNYTGDEQLDYVAAGMHSSLIGDMGKVGALRVIGKTSSNVYKNTDKSAPEIARELNVDALVEPTLTCYGDTVCVQIRVITMFPEEKQLWVAEYREDKSKILSLYNRVTKKIADEVMIELTPEEESLLADSRTVDKEAYEAYLKGLYYWDQFTPEALQLALEHFQKAIEADSEWAEPYAGVAYYWIAIRQFGLAPNSVTVPKIYEGLNEASRLDPNSTFTLYVSALASVWTGFNWEKGEKEFLKVIEINPNDAFARIYYAHLLMSLKRDDEAVEQGQLAADLDPLNPMIQALCALALAYMDLPDRAIQYAKKALSLAPENYTALSALTIAYIYKKDFEKSLEAWLKYLPVDEENRNTILNLFNTQGFDVAIKKYAEEVEKIGLIPPIDLATLYAFIRDYPKAMDLIEQSYEDHNANTPYIGSNCFKEGPFMIDDPRLDSLLIEMNLPLSTSN